MGHRRTFIIVIAALALAGLAGIATAQEELEVSEIILGTALENGVPTTPATTFSRADGALYCVVRLVNRTGAEGAIRVAFEPAEGEPAARQAGQRLEFPARPRYRTVARGSTSRAAGRHRCVVRTDEGAVLSHADFEITE